MATIRNISVARDAVTLHLVLEMSRHLDANQPLNDHASLIRGRDLGVISMINIDKRYVRKN